MYHLICPQEPYKLEQNNDCFLLYTKEAEGLTLLNQVPRATGQGLAKLAFLGS